RRPHGIGRAPPPQLHPIGCNIDLRAFYHNSCSRKGSRMITDSTSKRMLDAINLQRAKLQNASSDKILRAYDASIEKYRSSTVGSAPPLPPLQPAGDEGTLGQTGTSQGRTQTKPGLSVSATSAPE